MKIEREGTCLYELDDNGVNYWSAVAYPNNGHTHQRALQAALLMGAAHDLLEALEETHAALTLKVPEYVGSPLYTRNSAAIAKAKGEL